MSLFTEKFLPLIENSGKTDIELEKAMNLPRSIIYDWKTGRNKSSYKKYASNFASYFNVSTDYLLGNEVKSPTVPASDDQIKFALFGTTEVDDELYEDIKKIAKIQQQLKAEKAKKG